MTKADLIDSVTEELADASRKAKLKTAPPSKRLVGDIVDLILDEIRDSLVKGDKVQLIPFGSFVVRDRAKREGRNPKTGDKLTIPARRVPAFSAGKGLRDAVAASGKKRGAKKK